MCLGNPILYRKLGVETMEYDVFFWNVFENYGMPEAYMNYKQFSMNPKEVGSEQRSFAKQNF